MSEIGNENNTPEVEKSLEDILAGYSKPFVDESPTPTTQPTNTGSPFPWENGGNNFTPSPTSQNHSGISIQHNPAGSDPEIRYYKSGPKKGQPRPPRKGQPTSKPTTLQASSFLTGAILLSLVDMLFPMVMAGLNNWKSKVKIKADDLKLTDANKKELAPIADAVLKELNIVANPAMLLGVALFGAYATNMMVVRSESEAKMKLEKLKTNEANKQGINQTFGPNDVRRIPNNSY